MKSHRYWRGLFSLAFSLLLVIHSGIATAQEKEEDGLLIEEDADLKSVHSEQAPVRDSSTSKGAGTGIQESEEDLILDGGEENIIAPVKQSVSDTNEKAITTKNDAGQDSVSNKNQGTDQSVSERRTEKTESTVPARKVTEKPAKVEDMNSINFARNMKEYRSPKVAMMLSLLLPGAGQIYAKNGLKAGAFGAAELAIIGVGSAFAIKGKRAVDKAHKFADQHYKISDFTDYYNKLKAHYSETLIKDTIFAGYDPEHFSHDGEFYQIIEEENLPYVQGWDDVEPRFDQNFDLIGPNSSRYSKYSGKDSTYFVFKDNDTLAFAYGFSNNQKIYKQKVSDANNMYRVSNRVFALLLINHILSAIDAGLTAKAYNDGLLEKQTFLQRIQIREQIVNTGSGMTTGYALQVSF